MAEIKGLDAHRQPPELIQHIWKNYQKCRPSAIDFNPHIIDLQQLNPENLPKPIALTGLMSREHLQSAFDCFILGKDSSSRGGVDNLKADIPIFMHDSISGLCLIPSLFPPSVQVELLSRLFHRDLSDSNNQTNIHVHYEVTYPSQLDDNNTSDVDVSLISEKPEVSFFQDNPKRILSPKDPNIHKPMTIQRLLDKRLHWITLGGQYNWTSREYPMTTPPPFPGDIGCLLRAIFPETDAQAAIVNIYSATDTMCVHRDVSEECDIGLISVSFGCDGLFLVSHDDEDGCEIIRVRSGDAIYMAGKSRFAWHGAPKVLPSTCPVWLQDWPGCESAIKDKPSDCKYNHWRGWMSGKRINLNVRQITDSREHPRLSTTSFSGSSST